MTLPNGLDGISEAIGTLFASGGPLTPVPGAATWGSLGISQMDTLTQDVVTALLGQNIIKDSPNWNGMSSAIYQGLTPGIPWALAIIEQFVSAVTGLPLGTWNTVNEALLALEGIASNVDLEANWTTLLTDLGVANAAELASYISALQGDFTASQANSATLWTSWGTAFTEIIGGDWAGGLDDAETAWETYQTAQAGVASAEYVTIRQLLASIGINLPSGQMDAANVTSGIGLANLTDDWNQVVSFWDNLFGIGENPTTTQVKVASVASPTGATNMGTDITAAAAAATTAGTNASIAIASNQATNDAIVTATTGASVTGSSTTDVTTGLSNIPATNIVGQTGAAVAYGAAGGNTLASSPVSWTHTIAAGDLGVLVSVGYLTSGVSAPTFSATYGGVAMTQIASQSNGIGSFDAPGLVVFWLKAPPAGSKTVVVTRTSGSSGSLWVDSISYSASKIGSVLPNTGGGSNTLSMSATSQTGRMVFAVFMASNPVDTTASITVFNQTQRYRFATYAAGDAAGAASVSFTATMNATHTGNTSWAGVTIELTN